MIAPEFYKASAGCRLDFCNAKFVVCPPWIARAILSQSYRNPTVVAQVVRDAHRVFGASLETKDPAQPVRNSTIFLQAVLCFFWAAADSCLSAWERASELDNKEL